MTPGITVAPATTLSRRYQVCLIIITVFALYYPAIFAEVSILDDREAITSLFNLESFDIGSMFFPRAKDGGYYRPFLGVSYLIDRFWWFLSPQIMHFENILMHLANSLLVFFVGIRLCHREPGLLPLAGALLFALHPINTESINWISGRTDPMACMFVLSALYFVLIYREQRRVVYLAVATFMTVCGIFSKETAFGFILGAVFVLAAEREPESGIQDGGGVNISPLTFLCYSALAFLAALVFTNFYAVIILGILFWLHLVISGWSERPEARPQRYLVTSVSIVVAGGVIVAFFLLLRKTAYVSDTSKLANTLKAMVLDPNYTLQLYLGAAGFYVKKFLLPTPLNLAIREIDPLYELFGVVCFMACMALIYLRRVYSSLILAGFMMLSPAFLFVFGTIAWTGYAERYVYIPSAFWILAGVCYIDRRNVTSPILRNSGRWVFVCVAVYFAVSSFQRNLLWRTNVDIIKDTVAKSPDFKNVRGLYMSALVEKKDFAEAERQYHVANKIKVIVYDERYDLMYATILMNLKRYSEVEKLYQEVERRTKGRSTELYEDMIAFYDSRIFELRVGPEVVTYRQQKIAALEKLYQLNKSPFTAYRLGQNYVVVGKNDLARETIRSAIAKFRKDEPLKHNAEVLLKKLEQKMIEK